MNEMIRKEPIATRLQTMVCDALCHDCKESIEWLLIGQIPNEHEATYPAPGSFIWSCRRLGINWLDLKRTLEGALEIPAENPVFTRKHLSLVHSRKLAV